VVADYRYDQHLTVYAGVFDSRVTGGLAAGYINGGVLSGMTGVRFAF